MIMLLQIKYQMNITKAMNAFPLLGFEARWSSSSWMWPTSYTGCHTGQLLALKRTGGHTNELRSIKKWSPHRRVASYALL